MSEKRLFSLVEGSVLWKGMGEEEFWALLGDAYVVKFYRPGDLLAMQGDRCQGALMLMEGKVRGTMMNQAGQTVVIEELEAPCMLAPSFLYASDQFFPVEVSALTGVSVLWVGKDDFTRMLQQSRSLFLNYLRLIADKSVFLTGKIRLLRFGSMKTRLAGYLLEMAQREGSAFYIPHSQQELADLFGVTRPALARTLKEMASEGLFCYGKNRFWEVNEQALREICRQRE